MIATWLNTNIRDLEGALQNVIMRARVFNKPITQDLAKAALQDIINTKSRISVENIQKTVADHFNIKIADMHSKRKTANVAFPRQIAMYLSKEFTQKSLIDIGNEFGGRDHATVLYAIKKINKERSQNQELNHTLHLIEQKLKSWN
jgi:chromosomal replication initiator protein